MTPTLTTIEQPVETEPFRYPISEIFQSIQGEGQFAGTAMTFIRFAGCTVGKPYAPSARNALGLQPYQERCCDWAGNNFSCDTNYRQHARLTVEEIVSEVGDAKRVCLTGGEPLMHDLDPLIRALKPHIHIETSGTIELTSAALLAESWVTVSPKFGCLDSMLAKANEVKILVGQSFDEQKFTSKYRYYFNTIWVQPINQEHEIDQLNLQRCVQLVLKYPQIRLSSQLHKLWKCR